MIKGLKRVFLLFSHDDQSELKEARFIWTEEHSRRIIIELDIQKEIENGFAVVVDDCHFGMMQGKTRVTFKETFVVCPDCNRTSTNFTWEALVQIRQHVVFYESLNLQIEHKRTLLWLEQMIIANRRHSESIGVQVKTYRIYLMQIVSGGLDFYFYKKNEALEFIEHIKSLVICRCVPNSIYS